MTTLEKLVDVNVTDVISIPLAIVLVAWFTGGRFAYRIERAADCFYSDITKQSMVKVTESHKYKKV